MAVVAPLESRIRPKNWDGFVRRSLHPPSEFTLTKFIIEEMPYGGGNQCKVKLCSPNWQHDEDVFLDFRSIPGVLRHRVTIRTELFALVNLNASVPSDLNFLNIRLAADFSRTLVRVHGEPESHRFFALLPAWNPRIPLPWPNRDVPSPLWSRLRAGMELTAYANLDAVDSEQLELFQFEEAPPSEPVSPPPAGVELDRTMIEILAVRHEQDGVWFDVDMSGWDGETPASLGASVVPWFLLPRLKVGTLFFARVNLEETDSRKLLFYDFELAPQLGIEDVKARLSALARS